MHITLVILTLNERECLEKIFPQIPSPGQSAGFDQIVAVDGGSTDGTLEFFNERHIPVIAQSQRGRGQAFHEAFRALPNSDALIFFSPDGNEDPNDLKRFKPLLASGSDLIIASRMMKASFNEEDIHFFKPRKWVNNAFNFIANLFFRQKGPYITDSINGYRALTKAAYLQLNLDAQDYTIEYQMTIRSLYKGLRIAEFPTIEGQRVAGETGAPSLPTGIRFIKRLLKEIFDKSWHKMEASSKI